MGQVYPRLSLRTGFRPRPLLTSRGSILRGRDPLSKGCAFGSTSLSLQPIRELRRVVPAAFFVACEGKEVCETRPGTQPKLLWGLGWRGVRVPPTAHPQRSPGFTQSSAISTSAPPAGQRVISGAVAHSLSPAAWWYRRSCPESQAPILQGQLANNLEALSRGTKQVGFSNVSQFAPRNKFKHQKHPLNLTMSTSGSLHISILPCIIFTVLKYVNSSEVFCNALDKFHLSSHNSLVAPGIFCFSDLVVSPPSLRRNPDK